MVSIFLDTAATGAMTFVVTEGCLEEIVDFERSLGFDKGDFI